MTLLDGEHLIYFENEAAERAFKSLLEHRCKVCKSKDLKTLKDLDIHLRKDHELHLCDLCVENLRVFSHERKYYSRKDLIQHRKYGDPEDSSHRGHPDCKFCDVRFMDEEDLHRHLRKDHYHCHICDPTGLNQFYDSYPNLREHYRVEHFLCQEGPCREEKFTSVFRSEIDLQAHRMAFHCLTKTEAREARILNLDFSLKPRGSAMAPQLSASVHHNMYRSKPGQGKNNDKATTKSGDEETDHDSKLATQELPRPEDFPSLSAPEPSAQCSSSDVNKFKDPSSLSGYATSADKSKDLPQRANLKGRAGKGKGGPSFSTRAGGGLAKNDDEFPALGSSSSPFLPPSSDPTVMRRELKNYCSLSSVAAAVSATVPKVVSKITTVPCLPTTTCTNGINGSGNKSISTQSLISSNGSGVYNLAMEDFPVLPEPAPGRKKKVKSSTNGNKSNSNNSNTSSWDHNSNPQSKQFFAQSKQYFAQSKQSSKADFAAKVKSSGQQESKNAKTHPINPTSSSSTVVVSSSSTDTKSKSKSKHSKKSKEGKSRQEQQQEEEKSSSVSTEVGSAAVSSERSSPLVSQVVRNCDDSKVIENENEFPDLQSVTRILNEATNNFAVKSILQNSQATVEGTAIGNSGIKMNPPPGFTSMTPSVVSSNKSLAPPPGFGGKRGAPLPPSSSLGPEMSLSSVAQVIVSDNNLSSSMNNSRDENGNTKEKNEEVTCLEPTFKSNNLSASATTTFGSGARSNNSNVNHGSVGNEVILADTTGSDSTQNTVSYVSPNNFEERNLTLFQEVVDLLHRDQQKFSAFKKISDEFRKGDIRAEDYYKKCLELFDSRTSFHKIFLELIALLPNVRKQNELLAAHEKNLRLTRGAIPKRTRSDHHHSNSSSTGVWIVRTGTSIEDGLLVCPKCQQVLAKKDGPEHMSSHSL